MLNFIIPIIISIITTLGVINFNPISIWDKPSDLLGTASFPTSLATLTNPGATDSVATVSHSSQHANANDEIEAIEAKVGTGASTPTSGTVLYGNGVGSSAWSASPSITSLILSGTGTIGGLGTFGSFISNASSTVVGGLNITGNSTSTNATSTNLFATSANFTNLNGTNVNGYGLSTCSGGDFVQWSNGTFGCGAPAVTTSISTSTTDNIWYASTTITGITANKMLDVAIYVGTSTVPNLDGTEWPLAIVFNNSHLDDIASCSSKTGVTPNCTTAKHFLLAGSFSGQRVVQGYINMTIDNLNGHYRQGEASWTETIPTSPYPLVEAVFSGRFSWATTTPITSITVGLLNPTYRISSTTINVYTK